MSKNRVEKKVHLGMEVRVVNNEYIILRDMFEALGRVREDGTWTDERKKLEIFLEDIGKKESLEKIGVLVKQGKSRVLKEMPCLKIETVPIVLTQFRPKESKKKTVEENQIALNKWREFMKFVDNLLSSLEVYNFIITDKEFQKDKMELLIDAGGSAMVTNQHVNTIMAKLIGVYDQGIKRLKKEELKVYQNQITVDLLTVREFVLDKFVNAFEFTGSHKQASEMAQKLARKKYNL